MQTIIKKWAGAAMLVAFCLGIFSFANPGGGDHFQISLNHKVVLQQFLHGDKAVKNLVLTEANYNDKISVMFSHCGQTGSERSITLTDAQDRLIKKWTFANATGRNTAMSFYVKEIMDLQKSKGNITLKLSYAAKEMPKGMVLVSIPRAGTAVASR